jgi:plastocyanin
VITRRTGFIAGAALAAGLAIGFAGTVLAADPTGGPGYPSMMGGSGMMGGGGWGGQSFAPGSSYGPGMMGGSYGPGMMGGASWNTGAQPGAAGFVAGTPASPRVIHVIAGPGYTFSPPSITVERGETVTFLVTAMGPLVHEFMVGPADAVAADKEGAPEVADIGMMQTKSLTYTFNGTGPFAYACHATGHYEAGMRGTITVAD